MPWMATLFMVMPQTLLEQLLNLAGPQHQQARQTFRSLPTTQLHMQLDPVTWMRLMDTHLVTALMDMSWFQKTSMFHITILEPSRPQSVVLHHKCPSRGSD